jgi:hypothetical protein
MLYDLYPATHVAFAVCYMKKPFTSREEKERLLGTVLMGCGCIGYCISADNYTLWQMQHHQ